MKHLTPPLLLLLALCFCGCDAFRGTALPPITGPTGEIIAPASIGPSPVEVALHSPTAVAVAGSIGPYGILMLQGLMMVAHMAAIQFRSRPKITPPTTGPPATK